MSLFSELKRRNVLRVAAAYVVVAWLLIQVTETIFPLFGFDDTPARFVVIVLAIGFIPTVVLAWAFELTPDGIKKDKDIDRNHSVSPLAHKKLDRMIMVVLAIAVGYFAFDKFVLSSQRDLALQEKQIIELEEAREVGRTEALYKSYGDKSIAVLPFVDMSKDKDQEYMSDGIAEELLNLLTRIPDLRVISRSSAFSFKGKGISIPEVASQLNVSNILEGSVRKAGKTIRIRAQLIDGKTDTLIWSETYDRAMDNIFAVQDEIAVEVVKQLKVQLLGAAPTIEKTDPEAYALYLQARHLRLQRTPESLERAIALYQQALKIAPDYAAAWVDLGNIYQDQAGRGMRLYDEALQLARQAVDEALAINSDFAPAHGLLGLMAMYYDNDLAAAARHLGRALELEPGNLDNLGQAATLLKNLGRVEQGISVQQYILARDPVNVRVLNRTGLAYHSLGRPDEALSHLRTVQRLNPDNIGTQTIIGLVLLQKNEPEAALAAIRQEPFEAYRLNGLVMVYHALGQTNESDAALAEYIDKHEQGWSYNIAYDLAYRSEADRAFEWLAKAVEYKDAGLAEIPATLEFANIHDDSRWLPFLESIGKSPAQLDAIEFWVTLPK